MFELAKLKQLFFDEIMNHISSNHPRRNRFDVMIDINESWILSVKGFINFGNDKYGNFKIWELNITEAIIQFPDFEGTLNARYVSELEKYCTE